MASAIFLTLFQRMKCAYNAFRTCDGTNNQNKHLHGASHRNASWPPSTHQPPKLHTQQAVQITTEAPTEKTPESSKSQTVTPAMISKIHGKTKPSFTPPKNKIGFTFSHNALAQLEELGTSKEEILSFIKNATSYPSAENDNVVIYRDQALRVVADKANNLIRAVQPALEPEEGFEAPVYKQPGIPKLSGQKSKREKVSAPDTTNEFKRQLTKFHGFGVALTGSSHYRVTHPDHPGKSSIFPSTPSGQHWYMNACADIFKKFDVEVRYRDDS